MTAHSSQAALITPRGRGAVATWRIKGDQKLWRRLPFESAISLSPIDQPVGRILFGHWQGEKVVLTRLSESEWELHCHGGTAAVSRIQADLESSDCRILSWQELVAETETLLESEFTSATTQAVTWKTTEFLLRHPASRILERLENWKRLAHESPDNLQTVIVECDRMLSWRTFSRRLTEPALVVLAGAPNVGKSSLLNRLAGYNRTIVQNQPGTTRDVVGVDIVLEGFPITLTDTAGLRDTDDRLESMGISRAREVLQAADLILHLVDISLPDFEDDQQFASEFPHAMTILHKADCRPHTSRTISSELPVSSLSGEGVDSLIATMMARLVPKSPSEEDFFPVTDRQAALVEQIRETAKQGNSVEVERLIDVLIHGESTSC